MRYLTFPPVLVTLSCFSYFLFVARAQSITLTRTATITSTRTFYISSTSTAIQSSGSQETIVTEVTEVTATVIETDSTKETSVPTSTSASQGDDGTSYAAGNLRPAILNSTNYYRNQYIATPLTWNTTLASFAKSYSKNCLWQHSGGPYGENLAEGFTTVDVAVAAWANEESKYDYRKSTFSEATGHFTQLAWQNTTSIGCAATQCKNDAENGANGWFLVCEYWPRGNIIGEFKGMVRKPGISADGQLGFGGAIKTRGEINWFMGLGTIFMLLAAVV
ncbi:Hypothetical protein R9X50_00663100 [Acrodontium crateriforme]|uniref:SCP domain-containing protein n=1 Tax=Acrodontium crateriforme TaxID=150365 RepID=A0AAQ3RDQ0_9PEZI|nr:Hypothetical protein R9X50_00663100 [Acrodontium crateriforme]